MFLKDYFVLFRRLIFATVFYSLYRGIFYFYNLDYFSKFAFGETVFAFFYGLRFDVATVLIANLIFILISLIPLNYYRLHLVKKIVFVLFNSLFLGIIVIDWEFFSFIGKKITLDIFTGGMATDVLDQFLQVLVYYWYLTGTFFGTALLMWKFYPRRKRDIFASKNLSWKKVLAVNIIILLSTGVGVRGGTQMRSISPKEAFIHDSYELGNLSLNAAYSMVRSIGKKNVPLETYFRSDNEALDFLKKQRVFSLESSKNTSKDNVVIIILESFSKEYVDEGYTPFFSELKSKGLYFEDNFANGRRSIEALPSIITGMPSLIGQPIYQSQYQSNQSYALPKILKRYGYQTAFYHGGKKGTMDFDAYCYSIGFDKYFALEDYPNQSHFDGNWGIYDHHYLNYFADELDKYKEPFFTSIFTLSSHQPYSVPSEFLNRFSKGKLEIHESIGYADESLRLFFDKIKHKSWFNNTLFILTADHTSKMHSTKYNNLLGRYRVPLLFYHPNKDLSGFNTAKVTQHADILPSIVDFLGVDLEKRLYFGSSVFSEDKGRMINFSSDSYLYLKDPYLLRYDKNSPRLFRWDRESSKLSSYKDEGVLQDILLELKAYIQYTNNGLRNNNIYQ